MWADAQRCYCYNQEVERFLRGSGIFFFYVLKNVGIFLSVYSHGYVEVGSCILQNKSKQINQFIWSFPSPPSLFCPQSCVRETRKPIIPKTFLWHWRLHPNITLIISPLIWSICHTAGFLLQKKIQPLTDQTKDFNSTVVYFKFLTFRCKSNNIGLQINCLDCKMLTLNMSGDAWVSLQIHYFFVKELNSSGNKRLSCVFLILLYLPDHTHRGEVRWTTQEKGYQCFLRLHR